MKLGKEVVVTFAARASVIGGTVIINFVLGRFYSGTLLGEYISLYSLVLFCSLLSRFGTDTYLVRDVGAARSLDAPLKRKIGAIYFGAVAISFLVSSVLVWYGKTPLFVNPIDFETSCYFVIASMVMSVNYTCSAVLKGLRKSYLSSFLESGGCLLIVSLGSYFLYVLHGDALVSTLMLITVCALILQAVAGWWWGREFLAGNVFRNLRDLKFLPIYRESATFFPISLAGFVNQWGAVIIMGAFLTSQDIGIWNAVQKTSYVIIFALMVFNGVLSPRYARLANEGRNEELKVFSKKMSAVMSVLACPVVLIFLFFSERIMLLYGADFVVGAVPLLIMSLAQAFNLSTGSVGIILNMSGKQGLVSTTTCALAILNVLSLYLVGRFSPTIESVAFVSAMMIVIQNSIFLVLVRKTQGFWNFPSLKV
ncbi:MAG: oligosaccharide flippase family protein [Alcanivoracaceae bacterium]|nr:oligosaccharide flippase family protein [Alcanivoracaceae bacterium]